MSTELTTTNDQHVARRRFLTTAAVAGVSCLMLPRVTEIALAAEPTLEETLDWLAGKINRSSTRNHYRCMVDAGAQKVPQTVTHEGYVESWKKDEFVFKFIETQKLEKSDELSRDVKTYTFNLADLDPTRAIVREWDRSEYSSPFIDGDKIIYEVLLIATNLKPAVSYHRHSETDKNMPDGHLKDSSTGDIEFRDKDLAERVVKAFAHAIRLSGGKETKEVF